MYGDIMKNKMMAREMDRLHFLEKTEIEMINYGITIYKYFLGFYSELLHFPFYL